MQKFFVLGGYLSFNPGDVAILKATVARLERLHPQSHFVIWCDNKNFSVSLPAGVSHEYFIHRCPEFFRGVGVLSRILLRLYLFAYPFSQTVLRRQHAAEYEAVVQKIRACDRVVFVGGGYLNSIYSFDLMQLHHLYCLAKESERPIYLLGQTVGPFRNRWYRRIASSIFRGSERIVTREKYSALDLSKFSGKVLEGVDDALDFQGLVNGTAGAGLPAKYFQRANPSQVLLGLSLRPAYGPALDTSELWEGLNRFNTEFAGGLLKVIFVPMQTSAYSDDRKEAERLGRAPGKNFEFMVLADPLSVEEKFSAISKTDLFLGMRFHSLVFALQSGVPCLGLFSGDYYLKKNRGLLEVYGMGRYCLQTNDLSQLTSLLGELFQQKAKLSTDLRQKHAQVLRKQEELYRALF